ncbi:thaumatin family protein [Streptomyces galbus]|uniref:Thaumatin pathogenesis-related protein n=1 Tax=Streptomyces galbus TaxID=33898 RepID=A0A4U5X702_STRGB|nr:thaumatin family protein [Streptomyces galbus]TKT09931.1 Thaumatin pathogenesis-related protein [Streptomyces galbus]
MARGRRRRGAHPPRGRRWWHAAVAALVAVAAVLVVHDAWAPSGDDSVGTAHRERATEALPSGSRAAPPAPTASPNGSAQPSASPSAETKTKTKTKPRTEPKSSADASAKATGSGTSGRAQRQSTSAPAGQRLITVVNKTHKTIWAVVTDTAVYPAGRKLAPGQVMSVTVADNWAGRIWGRTGCATTAASICASGDCTSVCSGANPPTTLGEFTFSAFDDLDFYDVSMVDGANLPMYINVSHTTTVDPVSSSGCYRGRCTTEVECPKAMQALRNGQEIGCKPPCAAFGGDTYCCRGTWAGREHCLPAKWPVDYTQVFKRAAPYAYSYAFDDSATMSCRHRCYYRVTFGTTHGT